MTNNDRKDGVSRRDFIRAAGLVGGAAWAAQLFPTSAASIHDTLPVRARVHTLPGPEKNPIAGAIDMHVHSAPDNVPRSVNCFELAQSCKNAGMRGVVLYNHHVPTNNLAYLTRLIVPGIDVFGGVALNDPIGGINAAAVDMALSFYDGGCMRYVKMPSQSSGNDLAAKAQQKPAFGEGPGLWVMLQDGNLNPAVEPILKSIAKADILLMSGHIHPLESYVLFKAAKELGVKKMLLNHAMTEYIIGTHLKAAQVKPFIDLGVYIELIYTPLRTGTNTPTELAKLYKEIGPKNIVMSSDLGNASYATPAEGFRAYVTALLGAGITEQEMDLMIRKNPETLLGLAPAGPAV